MKPIRVLMVEDSATFVRGLEATLSSQGEFVVVGAAGNWAEAVTLAEVLQPDVALVDLRIAPAPGSTAADYRHGLEAIMALKATVAGLRVLAMSFSNDARWPVEAVRAGASGFVSKDAPPEEFVAALRTVAHGGVVLTAEQLARVASVPASPSPVLTPRELEVLRLLAEGKSNQQIARALGVTVGTVRTHVGNILGKLEVGSRGEAVAEARQRGIL
jgi:DNA-binding NarL/FixJ family response regulator